MSEPQPEVRRPTPRRYGRALRAKGGGRRPDGLSLRREPGAPFVSGGGRDRKEQAMEGMHRRRTLRASRWIPVLVMVVVSACAGRGAVRAPASSPSVAGSALFPLTLTDDDGVRVTIPAPPKRIITFAPS